MEFDIVELGNVNGRLRLSMEFDIIDYRLALKEFVWTRPHTVGRWSSTLLNSNERRWLNAKLKRTAGSPGCDTKQDLCQFDYYSRREGRTRWKFADQAERRKSLRRLSLSENELFDVLHLSKYNIVANSYDRKSGRLGRRCPCTNELEVDMVRDSSASSNWIVSRGRDGANSKCWPSSAHRLVSGWSSYTTAIPTTSIL